MAVRTGLSVFNEVFCGALNIFRPIADQNAWVKVQTRRAVEEVRCCTYATIELAAIIGMSPKAVAFHQTIRIERC